MDYFNEDYYLANEENYTARQINSLSKRYLSDVKSNALKYGSNIQAYDEYVSFIAYLIKCLGMPKDALNASMILGIITKMGIFSEDCNIITNEKVSDDMSGFLGINVVKGHAVCRHISSFQCDVLKKLNLISEPFYCYLSRGEVDKPQNMRANHMISLIEYKNNLYGYDTLNNGLYRFVSDRSMEELFKENGHYIYYKPYLDMMFGDMNLGNVMSMMGLFDIIKDKEIITYDNYKMINENAKRVVSKNLNLLDDFHESSKKYIKRITKNL